MEKPCANITNCGLDFCPNNNKCLKHLASLTMHERVAAYGIRYKNFKIIKHYLYCEKADKLSLGVAPCFGCNIKCRHVIKVSANRGISRILRQKVYDRDGNKCIVCGGVEKLTIDHLVPIMRGGSNKEYNLATMCLSCNNEKGGKMIQKYVELAAMQKSILSKRV